MLAACSIMIGIWAILITTSLSASISQAFIDSINKDPLGRLTQVYIVTGDVIQFIKLDDVKKDFAPIQDKIKSITPSRLLYGYSFYVNSPQGQIAVYSDEVSFPEFYDQNSETWIGKKDSFEKNEIAICYYCFGLGSGLGFTTPEDMLGKKISITFNDTISYSPIETVKKDGST